MRKINKTPLKNTANPIAQSKEAIKFSANNLVKFRRDDEIPSE
jgi:hypothetical protein